jgi:hypothetical protein
MTLHAKLTRPALVLTVLFLAACSTTASRTESGASPISTIQKTTALGPTTPPSPAAAATPRSAQVASVPSAASRPCSAQPAQAGGGCEPCSPAVAGPLPLLRCPPPPKPAVPPTNTARISLCAGLPGTPRAGPAPLVQPAVCGNGFGPYEVVTIILTGSRGSTFWSTMAGPRGTFDSPLPASVCRLVPGQVVARGNKGHVSNSISIPAMFCRPRL